MSGYNQAEFQRLMLLRRRFYMAVIITSPNDVVESQGLTSRRSGTSIRRAEYLSRNTAKNFRSSSLSRMLKVPWKGRDVIMAPKAAISDADPERVKVWAEYTREYGVYK
jgi:hypothetical protein